jgi:hypothetical protein
MPSRLAARRVGTGSEVKGVQWRSWGWLDQYERGHGRDSQPEPRRPSLWQLVASKVEMYQTYGGAAADAAGACAAGRAAAAGVAAMAATAAATSPATATATAAVVTIAAARSMAAAAPTALRPPWQLEPREGSC